MTNETKDELELVKYELMLILFPDLGEEGVNKELSELEGHLATDGGAIFHKDVWGLRKMTYRIRKQDEGFYVVLGFTLPPRKISELEKSLTINPGVIRFLVSKTPLNYEVKTLAEYQAQAKELEQKEEEAKKLQEEKSDQMKKAKTEKVVREQKVEKKVEKRAEVVEEKEEKVEVKKVAKKVPDKSKLEEVDQKLKNIIDDPDISL